MNNTISKPITVAFDDFFKDLVNLINNSGLPFFAVENALKNCLMEVNAASRQQIDADRNKYNQALQSINTDEQV